MKKGEMTFLFSVIIFSILFGNGIAWSADNLALRKTGYDSGHEDYYIANNAFDGNICTRWSSSWTDNQWIYVDLGDTFSVYNVILRWENAYGQEYKIQVSEDAAQWTDVAHISNGIKEDRTVSFSPINARFVKMLGIKRGTGWGYSLWEFEVYGDTIGTGGPGIKTMLSDYAVYSNDKTTVLADEKNIYGAIGSNTYVEVGRNAVVTGNLTSYGNAFLMYNSRINGDVLTKGNTTKESAVVITGTLMEGANIGPIYLQNKTVLYGTEDITIPNQTIRILAPGNYKDLMALSKSTIKMSSGTYQ